MRREVVNRLEPPAGEATPKPEAGDASQGEGPQLADHQAVALHRMRPLADPSPLPFLARCSRRETALNAGAGVGLIFPGRHTVRVGMLTDCWSVPGVEMMLAKAKDIVGYDIVDVCFKGPRTKLLDPRYGNAAAFLAGLAGLAKLRLEDEGLAGFFCAVSGGDIGVYTALCAAGALAFEDGLKLVQALGEAEELDGVTMKGGMVTIAGLDKPVLRKLCREAARAQGASSVCHVVQDISSTCYVCSGTERAISVLIKLVEGAGALHVTVVPRCGGVGTPLAKSFQEKCGNILKEVLPRLSPPQCELYLDLTGLPMGPSADPAEIVRLLTESVTRPLSLERMVRNMITDGVTKFIEIGTGSPMKYVVSQIDDTHLKTMRHVQV